MNEPIMMFGSGIMIGVYLHGWFEVKMLPLVIIGAIGVIGGLLL